MEVLNTDAEGRLVLADAVAPVPVPTRPALLVDVATLTGAQTVALGTRTAGVMASDDALAAQVADSARRAARRCGRCRCPRNSARAWTPTSRTSPTCPGTAAVACWWAGCCLREFVPDGVRWAHLDIAGPAFNDGGAYGYTPKGGTGAAVRTLVQLALDVADGTLAG